MSEENQDMRLAANALDAVGRIWNEEADPRDIARRVSNLVKPWRETNGVPGLVGRDCLFRVYSHTAKAYSEWFPGKWLAWSMEHMGVGDERAHPVALIEMETGEVCSVPADGLRFAPPSKAL